MTGLCTVCGRPFEAKRSTARYCSGRCRQHASVTRQRGVDLVAALSGLSIRDALSAEYAEHLLSTPEGATALRLADDVDKTHPGSPGYAAVMKQMREALDQLRRMNAPAKTTPLALIRARRAADVASSS